MNEPGPVGATDVTMSFAPAATSAAASSLQGGRRIQPVRCVMGGVLAEGVRGEVGEDGMGVQEARIQQRELWRPVCP